jgi:sushi domain-containing protein 2
MRAYLFPITLLLLSHVTGLNIENFIPFGNQTGDASLFPNDDSFAGPINISTPFRFFDNVYTSLFVNTNGLISFVRGVSEYVPQQFPLQTIIGVSPFWTDVDIRYSGEVYYREILDVNELNEIALEIRRAFPLFYNYRPTWAYVSTWYQVPEFGRTDYRNVNNTFQAIIATNGIYSFTIYNYAELQWPVVNVSSHRAQAGFNAGDGATFYIINGSFTQDVVNVTSRSNVGIDGKWIFRVDRANITSGGCSSSGFLTVTPVAQFYLGGENVTLLGPCFEMNDTVRVIYNVDSNAEIQVTCDIIDESSCTCGVPFLNKIGRIPLKLIVRENDTFFGWINSLNDPVESEIFGVDAFYTTEQLNQTLNITWNQKYSNQTFAIFGLFFATLQSDNKTVVYRQITDDLSNGYHLIELRNLLGVSSDLNESSYFNYMVIKLVDEQSSNRILPAAIVAGIRTLTGISIVLAATAGLRCDQWHASQPNPQPYLESLPPCIPSISPTFPPTLNGFTEDEACNAKSPIKCLLFHRGSKGCYRSTATGLDGSGQQCCYNSQGSLNIGPPSGGTLDKTSTSIDKIQHFYQDVLPYFDCCLLSNKCDKYYDKRPSDDGSRWRPPRPAG